MPEDKSVMVITGTRKGIGRFLAEHYVEKGFEVVGCSRGPSDLETPNYSHHEVDISDEKAVIAMFRDVSKRFGRLDVLINNAGIASMNHFTLTPGETAVRILNTNVVGTFLCCREAAKRMMRGKRGRIVNFSTVAVPLDLEGEAIYAASKAAVVTLTRVLAREVASMNITVNAIGPSPIATDLIRGIPKEKLDALLARHPLGRYGTFEDVSNVIDFFIKPESDCVSSQVLYLGGV